MNFITGFCAAVGIWVLLVIALMCGIYMAMNAVSGDCEKLGGFSFSGKVYKCTEIKDHKK